ncbi:hypothetical protein SAMN05421869_106113 [Nonomuraea jiangxiensis]|uniref:Uncharacterized protein n=2 Tax=Nonomuraea jiangxiensis TaxID=633440 RepID=A0A1G8LJP0_9ACTN|nr:hypothetical protein SAMN05421869_106113 [Nonomuraea jiangxiensis]
MTDKLGAPTHRQHPTGSRGVTRGIASDSSLLARMGQDNVRAAMLYQHTVRGADQLTTEAINRHLIGRERPRDDNEDDPPGLLVPAG